MKKWLPKILGPLGLIIFVGSLYFLQKELKNYTYADILNTLKAIPSFKIFIACCLSLMYYLVLGGYDVVAFKYIKVPLKFKDILFTCFISNALGNNTGYSMLFGGSIRYRLYSLHNVSMMDVTKVLFFSSATIWLGLLTIGGIVFTYDPISLEKSNFFFASTHAIGVFFLLILAIYFSLSFFKSKPRKIFKWHITFPSISIVSWQTLLAAVDWILASLVLYSLLPVGAIPYFTLLKIFLVAQLLGIISQVPGGMGVFESAIFLLIPSAAGSPAVMGALLAYRAIFYFFPLSIALTLLAVHEILRARKKFGAMSKIFTGRISSIIPQALTIGIFISGAIVMFAASTPMQYKTLQSLLSWMPVWTINSLHFISSICGVCLLFVARGLQLRIKKSYTFGCIFLIVAILSCILTFQSTIKTVGLSIMLVTLLPASSYFYRNVKVLSAKINNWWFIAIGGVFIVSVWIGFFVHSQDIQSWRSLPSFIETLFENTESSRFLRDSIGVFIILLIIFFEQMFVRFFSKTQTVDISTIKPIVQSSEYTYPYIALSADKTFILNDNQDTFIMYAESGSSCIALGDPVGKLAQRDELVWKFKEMCDINSTRPIFISIGTKHLHIYQDIGLDVIKLGKNALVPLWKLDTDSSIIDLSNSLEKDNYSFEISKANDFINNKTTYTTINEIWKKKSKHLDTSFLPGAYNESYMNIFDYAIVKKDGKIVAFSPIATSNYKNEASCLVIRHNFQAAGLVEYIVYKSILWAKEQDYNWFDLGLSATSSADTKESELIKNFSRFFTMSEHFNYSITSSTTFKSKFNPIWQNKYIAVNTSKFNFMFLKHLTNLIVPSNTNQQRRNFQWMRGKFSKKI